MIGHEVYDRFAPHFRAYAESRSKYLEAVDNYVCTHAARGGRMLDVGSGDGVRAIAIGRRIEASRIVLCEPSSNMAAGCDRTQVDAMWTAAAQRLPVTDERFDVITCLWNVLGHLPDRTARIDALCGMRRLLASGGCIFCDFNNRHNARAYGSLRVASRRLLDWLAPDERRGDSKFEWRFGGERIAATGHLFTAPEIRGLTASADLAVEQCIAVDYMTGESSRVLSHGQLLYRLGVASPSAGAGA